MNEPERTLEGLWRAVVGTFEGDGLGMVLERHGSLERAVWTGSMMIVTVAIKGDFYDYVNTDKCRYWLYQAFRRAEPKFLKIRVNVVRA